MKRLPSTFRLLADFGFLWLLGGEPSFFAGSQLGAMLSNLRSPGFLTPLPPPSSKHQQCMSPSPTLNLSDFFYPISFGSSQRKLSAFKGLM